MSPDPRRVFLAGAGTSHNAEPPLLARREKSHPPPGERAEIASTRIGPVWIALALITLAAGALRLASLNAVPDDPFYDAAVRSMSQSLHNFFLGAYEPSASVSIDKPPVDLWLQVLSVKLLGFNSTALKLPQALAGTAAVPLMFCALRRAFGNAPALTSAAALAVLPVSVLTARSDTMDAMMMLALVIALAALAHGAHSDRPLWLYGAAIALGVAFNVKLLEALIALPGLAVLAWLGLGGPLRRRAVHLLASGAVLVAVALSWLTATLVFPAHERPFAIGSTNGSAWNAAFVFNGYDRVAKPARVTTDPATSAKRRVISRRAARSNSDVTLDHIPINSPGVVRLFDRAGPLSGRRLGYELLIALLLGIPGLLAAAGWRPRRAPPGRFAPDLGPVRLQRAMAFSLLAWLVVGFGLFSQMTRLHPRYVEAFTPAVAAAVGVGLAWACHMLPWGAGYGAAGGDTQTGFAGTDSPLGERSQPTAVQRARERAGARDSASLTSQPARPPAAQPFARLAIGNPPRLALLAGVVGLAIYAHYLHGTVRLVDLVTVLLGAGALALSVAGDRRADMYRPALVLAAATVLALPITVAIKIVNDSANDSGHAGFTPAPQLRRLSAYLKANRRGAFYEVAAVSATQAGSLIVKDGLPVLVLTTYDGRVVVPVSGLAAQVAAGRVRYAMLGGRCHPGQTNYLAQCSAPGLWVRRHGVDVSRQAGQPQGSILWRLGTP